MVDPSTTGGFSSYTSTTAVDAFWLWLVAISYFVILEGFFGQTVGKVAVGIRVTGLDGARATAWQIVIRNVFRVIDWLPVFYFLGALVARVTGGRQRIGDHVARTIVVPAGEAVGPWPDPDQTRQRKWVVAALLVVCGAFSYYGRPPTVLGNLAAEGRFPGGVVSDYRHGTAQLKAGSVTYPVSYTLSPSGKSCAGSVTLQWHGFLEGWQMSSAESNC